MEFVKQNTKRIEDEDEGEYEYDNEIPAGFVSPAQYRHG
jgi:hypothetical protein